jgi:hypothetical protein
MTAARLRMNERAAYPLAWLGLACRVVSYRVGDALLPFRAGWFDRPRTS